MVIAALDVRPRRWCGRAALAVYPSSYGQEACRDRRDAGAAGDRLVLPDLRDCVSMVDARHDPVPDSDCPAAPAGLRTRAAERQRVALRPHATLDPRFPRRTAAPSAATVGRSRLHPVPPASSSDVAIRGHPRLPSRLASPDPRMPGTARHVVSVRQRTPTMPYPFDDGAAAHLTRQRTERDRFPRIQRPEDREFRAGVGGRTSRATAAQPRPSQSSVRRAAAACGPSTRYPVRRESVRGDGDSPSETPVGRSEEPVGSPAAPASRRSRRPLRTTTVDRQAACRTAPWPHVRTAADHHRPVASARARGLRGNRGTGRRPPGALLVHELEPPRGRVWRRTRREIDRGCGQQPFLRQQSCAGLVDAAIGRPTGDRPLSRFFVRGVTG